MKIAACTICMIGLLPALVIAQEPTTRPHRMGPPPPRFGEAQPPPRHRPEELSPEKIAAAEAFISEHSPRRWEAYVRLQADPQARENVRRAMLERWRMMQDLKADDPDLFSLHLRRMKVEDSLYGLSSDVQRPDSEVILKIRTLVGELVDIGFAERAHRIARAEKSLIEARERLAMDKERREQVIEERMNSLPGRGRRPLGIRRGDRPEDEMMLQGDRPPPPRGEEDRRPPRDEERRPPREEERRAAPEEDRRPRDEQ